MNIQNTEKVVQEFKTFVAYAEIFGLDTNTNLPVIRAAFKKGLEIGEKYHVKDCNKNIIPPLQENKTVIQKDILELKKIYFRSVVIEHILKTVERPLTPSELGEIAKIMYDVHWYEKSVCGFIQHAMEQGKKIQHITNGGRRGKYVHSDYADRYKQDTLLEEGAES
jgi:hypothetical protein